jgi:V/A-type H+-transporting ATPase subunit A
MREDILQQNAFDDVDMYCPAEKQYSMIANLHKFAKQGEELIAKGKTAAELEVSEAVSFIGKMKYDRQSVELGDLK